MPWSMVEETANDTALGAVAMHVTLRWYSAFRKFESQLASSAGGSNHSQSSEAPD